MFENYILLPHVQHSGAIAVIANVDIINIRFVLSVGMNVEFVTIENCDEPEHEKKTLTNVKRFICR